MKACVTGATGFVGAHVVRALAERGDEVRVAYRNPNRLQALNGVDFRQAKTDILDYRSMCRAVRGSEVLFHVAGYVASSPMERVWELNADDWYVELIEAGAFEDSPSSGLSRWADSMQMASRLGLLTPVRVGQRLVGRRLVAGG